MIPIHIIGQASAGKTSLIVDIIKELNKQNLKVGSIKHSSHTHELDRPDKDSFQHRKAGASLVSMVNQEMTAVYLPGAQKDYTSKTFGKILFQHGYCFNRGLD